MESGRLSNIRLGFTSFSQRTRETLQEQGWLLLGTDSANRIESDVLLILWLMSEYTNEQAFTFDPIVGSHRISGISGLSFLTRLTQADIPGKWKLLEICLLHLT